jgi:Tfp pilus assembly protein PilF
VQLVTETVADETVLKEQALSLWSNAQKIHLRGDLEHAIELYTQSIAIYPTAEAYTFRGWAYSFQGRVDDAIEECKKAIVVDPTFGNPYNDIGSYLIAKGQFTEAIEWLLKAKAAPRYEPRHFPFMNLGRIYAHQGRVLLAIEEFKSALEIHPGEQTCVSMLKKLRGWN